MGTKISLAVAGDNILLEEECADLGADATKSMSCLCCKMKL